MAKAKKGASNRKVTHHKAGRTKAPAKAGPHNTTHEARAQGRYEASLKKQFAYVA